MTDRYSEQQSVKKRKKFVIFKRKPKFDEEGNPIYVKKKKLYSYHRLNRTFTGDLVLTLFLLFGGIFMLFPLCAPDGILIFFMPSRVPIWISSPNTACDGSISTVE